MAPDVDAAQRQNGVHRRNDWVFITVDLRNGGNAPALNVEAWTAETPQPEDLYVAAFVEVGGEMRATAIAALGQAWWGFNVSYDDLGAVTGARR